LHLVAGNTTEEGLLLAWRPCALADVVPVSGHHVSADREGELSANLPEMGWKSTLGAATPTGGQRGDKLNSTGGVGVLTPKHIGHVRFPDEQHVLYEGRPVVALLEVGKLGKIAVCVIYLQTSIGHTGINGVCPATLASHAKVHGLPWFTGGHLNVPPAVNANLGWLTRARAGKSVPDEEEGSMQITGESGSGSTIGYYLHSTGTGAVVDTCSRSRINRLRPQWPVELRLLMQPTKFFAVRQKKPSGPAPAVNWAGPLAVSSEVEAKLQKFSSYAPGDAVAALEKRWTAWTGRLEDEVVAAHQYPLGFNTNAEAGRRTTCKSVSRSSPNGLNLGRGNVYS